ncbi:tripartite motif-containing protein 16 isoform X2 [Danio rerio]|uniref:Tripartite motif-containing protein 16 n=1 Tax=Danio rerio TaxID=7955 RepID=A0A0G2LAJ1_DANRE|nr:tripartite motif-containing protein 16-like [Danio rerio]|eukprot:XP_002666648.1 tripartite motif-containing protein 16-like [Danio rerio]
MAESSVSWDQEFSCSICLDLKDPVTLSCGHRFCMSCITDCWNLEDQKRVYRCPQCRRTFTPRPALNNNVILAEMLEELKTTRLQTADCYAGSGDAECDVCTGRKLKAVKSCLVCLNSYCQHHLQQHQNLYSSKKHKLTDATGRLQEMICTKHEEPLKVYCRTDQQCVCYLCVMDEHKNHETVTAAAERTEKQRILKETQRQYQDRIQEQEKKLQDLRQAVDSHKRSAQAAVEDTESIFTQLIHSIERRRSEITQLIRDQEKTAVSQAEDLMKKLEKEIDDLKRRNTMLEQFSNTLDHIQFLQSFQSFSVSPGSADVSSITISSLLSLDHVGKSVSKLKEKLEDFCRQEIKKISVGDPETRHDFLQYSRLLSLDPNTVNKTLLLSERNTLVSFTNTLQQYPDHPDRFDFYTQVLCRESLYGRSYCEIEWSEGMFVAVAYKSIRRKGESNECLFGFNDHSWMLLCSSSTCSYYHNRKETVLPVLSSRRIGVYVDHSAGTLSFYGVSDTMSLIHRVQTTFTQPLYLGFMIGSNAKVKLCDLTV